MPIWSNFSVNWFDIAVLVEEGVGDDEALLLAHHVSQFIQGNRHAALLDSIPSAAL